jgi:hypothetical protein
MPGPPPKRDDQRRRVNTPAAGEAEHVPSDGRLRGPALRNARSHTDAGRRFYTALRRSGQAQFYEPSDWAAAELVVLAIDAYVERPSASAFLALQAAWPSLLVTEGDRRRARIELERAEPEGGDGRVSWINEYRGTDAGTGTG